MPFSEDVVYIYDKQIEEAGLVVVNKMDLLVADAAAETMRLLSAAYPEKIALPQSSLSQAGVAPWLEILEMGQGLLSGNSLEMDYERYGRGEALLAWLDEEVRLRADVAVDTVRRLIAGTLEALRSRGAAIGHVKFLLQAGEFEQKISFPTLDEPGWEQKLPEALSGDVRLLVNARVEMPAEELRALFLGVLERSGVVYQEAGVSYFHPKQPNPTHRYI